MDHRVKHGRRFTPEYTAWVNMRKRCGDPAYTGYKYYGGRGIRVAAEWDSPRGFPAFLQHVGPRPSPEHTLDRIDTDGDYAPGNVRWATRTQQTRSRRNTIMVVIDGVAKPLIEWAELHGIPHKTVEARIRILGWDAHRALNTPVRRKDRR